jgi:hypothetical protein
LFTSLASSAAIVATPSNASSDDPAGSIRSTRESALRQRSSAEHDDPAHRGNDEHPTEQPQRASLARSSHHGPARGEDAFVVAQRGQHEDGGQQPDDRQEQAEFPPRVVRRHRPRRPQAPLPERRRLPRASP